MKTNKGYSLAELLVSIAIFSVVMLSIVTIMRNASISYRNENAEVQLQENSQMLLSQIEELLVDAKSVSFNNGSKTLTVTDNKDKTHKIKLDSANHIVEYDYANSGYEVLATNVNDIKIEGLQSNNGDDKCKVVIEMKNTADGDGGNRTYTYKASKEVVFRNASVEKSAAHSDAFLTGGPTTTPTPSNPDTVNYKMGRYELLNLISEFDIDPSKTITISGDTSKYSFVKASGLNTSGYMATVDLITDGSTSGYLTTTASCNSTTNQGFSCTITGTTSANKNITINITTPKVKLLKGAGMVYIPINAINNGAGKNYYSYIEIEGICIRDAKEYFGKTCSGTLDFSDIPGNDNPYTGTIFDCSSDWQNSNKYGQMKLGSAAGSGMQSDVGLGYDPFCTDVLGVCFNGKCFEPDNTSGQNSFNGAKYDVVVTVTYPSGTSTATTSESYRVFTAGAKLSNLNP